MKGLKDLRKARRDMFSFRLAVKNVINRPGRSAGLTFLVMLLAFGMYFGGTVLISLGRGLEGYRSRLGADIVVTPTSAKGHGSVDDVLLQGITGNYYLSKKDIDRIRQTEGVESVSTQFFLTSAKAGCCSVRVQIIGFDPETDMTILPWVGEAYSMDNAEGGLVVGSEINVPENRLITFYGGSYRVVAKLSATGTGLDSAVFADMETVRKMAYDAKGLTEGQTFSGVDIDTAASAVFIKVADGFSPTDVADDINIHITKALATPARTMIADMAKGLSGISRLVGFIMAAVIICCAVVLLAVYLLMAGERRKEFAVLRTMGASRSVIFRTLTSEAAITGLLGAFTGVLAAVIVAMPFVSMLKERLGLPFLAPSVPVCAALGLGAFVISVCAGVLSAAICARRLTGSETGLLLREDAA